MRPHAALSADSCQQALATEFRSRRGERKARGSQNDDGDCTSGTFVSGNCQLRPEGSPTGSDAETSDSDGDGSETELENDDEGGGEETGDDLPRITLELTDTPGVIKVVVPQPENDEEEEEVDTYECHRGNWEPNGHGRCRKIDPKRRTATTTTGRLR